MNKKHIRPFFPDYRGDGEPIPSDIIGSKIIAFGSYSDEDSRNIEGGLIIECETADGSLKRLELAFTELGMGIHKWQ